MTVIEKQYLWTSIKKQRHPLAPWSTVVDSTRPIPTQLVDIQPKNHAVIN